MTPENIIVNPKCKSVAKVKSLTTLNIALQKPPSIETTNKICTKIENFDSPAYSNHRKNTINRGNFGILGMLALLALFVGAACQFLVISYACYLKKTRP